MKKNGRIEIKQLAENVNTRINGKMANDITVALDKANKNSVNTYTVSDFIRESIRFNLRYNKNHFGGIE